MEIPETDNNDIDFYKLSDEIEINLEKIWNDVIVPYINLDDNMKILNLSENNLNDFKSFFYKNSKYFKFVQNNINN